jgi:hypothetical protein
VIVWTDWPARRRPTRALIAAIAILVSIGVFTSVAPLYGIISAFVLLTVSAEILLPTKFRLSAEGVEAFNLFRHARRPWVRFRDWRQAKDGFYLNGQGPIGFLARRRSLWLPCPGRTAEVEAILEAHLSEAI